MLVINCGKRTNKEGAWVVLETSDGNIRVKPKISKTEIRLVIDAPENVNIKRENYNAKTANSSIANLVRLVTDDRSEDKK